MSRGSVLPDVNRSLPLFSQSRTCAGVDASCRCLRAAKSWRSGLAVEQPESRVSKSKPVAAPRGARSWLSRVFISAICEFSKLEMLSQGNILPQPLSQAPHLLPSLAIQSLDLPPSWGRRLDLSRTILLQS